ncbi:hypothetical protein Daesc_008764 [Daldinia eschscholtzii]|uniref:Uncharacterized protein n=1 Tax=Daldinia eschscholtzii TaxID=292717 RepID=A0AAX6MDD9_9PEZI
MAIETTTEGHNDPVSFLSLLEPLPDRGMSLETAGYLATEMHRLSQQMAYFDKKLNSIAESVANMVLLVQEIIQTDKPSNQPTRQAAGSDTVEQTPPSIPRAPMVPQLRREDIGRFNPGHPDERGVGMVTDGHTLIFTDVNLFVEHIESFLQNPTTAASNETQILSWLETLLAGAAAAWWTSELTRLDRRALRLAGLSEILIDLERRFRLDPAVAAVKFDHAKLKLREVAFDENRPLQFVRTKLRYAREMKLLDERDGEWLFVMLQIWFSMDLDVRGILRPPSPEHTLELYLQEISQATPALMSRALQLYH